jgi:hypothetical protein
MAGTTWLLAVLGFAAGVVAAMTLPFRVLPRLLRATVSVAVIAVFTYVLAGLTGHGW